MIDRRTVTHLNGGLVCFCCFTSKLTATVISGVKIDSEITLTSVRGLSEPGNREACV